MWRPQYTLGLIIALSASGLAPAEASSLAMSAAPPDQSLLVASAPATDNGEWRIATGEVSIEASLDYLTRQIVESLDESQRKAIAVVGFTDEMGGESAFGRFLAEELTTRLFLVKRFAVIERSMLRKVLEEQRLQVGTNLIDPDSAKEIGKLLGVDAIATGTYTSLGDTIRVNARLIDAQSGAVFGAAGVSLPRDPVIDNLMARTIARPGQKPAQPVPPPQPTTRKAARPSSAAPRATFHEDFKNVEEGLIPDGWITDDGVGVSESERSRCLTSFQAGTHRVTIPNVDFPADFDVEVLVASDNGFVLTIGSARTGLNMRDNTYFLTNASSVHGSRGHRDKRVLVTLRKSGPVFKLLVNGNQKLISRISNFNTPSSIVFENIGRTFKLYSVTVRAGQ